MKFSLFTYPQAFEPVTCLTKQLRLLTVCSLILFSSALQAQRGAVVLADVYLMATPSASASQLALIEEDSTVELIKRKGGWYQVKTSTDQMGWVRMLKVRYMIEQEENERSIAKILRETAAMPPASGISTGVRGISDTPLEKESEPGLQLDNMDQFVPTEEVIDGFGDERKLKSIDDLELKINE